MKSNSWMQIEIQDPDGLSGRSLVRLLRSLSILLPVHAIAVRDVEGSGEGINKFIRSGDVLCFELDDFIQTASRMVQFDWGDFFLLKTADECHGVNDTTAYAAVLPRALATVRAVDSEYFYVYTTNAAAGTALMQEYQRAKSITTDLEALTFPT